MVMADREGVRTASFPVASIDLVSLGAQLGAALARVPFRRPLAGPSGPGANLGASVSREVLRAFIGTATSLEIEEFRSIEKLIDRICQVALAPVVSALHVEERSMELGGVPGLLYRPEDRQARGLILYLHGGGFIGTSPRMYAAFVARLVRETCCAVFVADYRLAPEFPFPAGLQDAAAVLTALVARGAPPERLLLAGDSAGGGLGASVILGGAELSSAPPPAGLILFSPEVDLDLDHPSVRSNAVRDIVPWNVPTAAYLSGEQPGHPYVDLDETDLTGFPPTFVTWGGDEVFRDAIRLFVQHLAEAEVPHDAHEVPDMFHVFPIVMPWAEQSRSTYRRLARFVDGVLAGAPPLPERATER